MDKEARLKTFAARPASLADAQIISSVFIRSFRNDAMCRFMYDWPPIESPQRPAADAWSINLRTASMKRLICNSAWHFQVLEDKATGLVVGESGWILPAGSRHRRRLPLHERIASRMFWFYDTFLAPLVPSAIYEWIYPAEAIVYEKRARWQQRLQENAKKFVKPEHEKGGTWVLAILGILPEYERRGLGSKLLEWGLEKADEEDRPVYLSASPSGAGLYKKYGFEVVHVSTSFEGEPNGSFVGYEMCRPTKSERQAAVQKSEEGITEEE